MPPWKKKSHEVLRETLQQIAVEQTCLERQMAVDFVKHVLLYVKGLLLQWDVDNFPAPAGMDLPIPKMPQTFPNQCWSARHPRRDIFVEDIRAGLQCLRRYKAFTGEPWLWLTSGFLGIHVSSLEWRSLSLAAPTGGLRLDKHRAFWNAQKNDCFVTQFACEFLTFFFGDRWLWMYIYAAVWAKFVICFFWRAVAMSAANKRQRTDKCAGLHETLAYYSETSIYKTQRLLAGEEKPK